jgi:hypothetical protein
MDEVLPPVAAAGCRRGQPNFRAADDTMLSSHYVVVTTNAAIDTDQNGSTFWNKVRLGFIQHGGSAAGHTSGSLQNRFNKTIVLEMNKFIGMLANTLCEHHSGWALEDYTHDAMPSGSSLQSFRSRSSMKHATASSRRRLRSLRSTWTLFIRVSSVQFSFAPLTTHRRLMLMSMSMAEMMIAVMLATLLLMLVVFALVLFVLSVSLLEWFHQALECTLPVLVLEKQRKLCCRILQVVPTRTRNKN